MSGAETYRVTRPLTTRSGKLPGQRAEAPLAAAQLDDLLASFDRRGVTLRLVDGVFELSWPSREAYYFRDVERVRVNFDALLLRLGYKQAPVVTPGHGFDLGAPPDLLPLAFVDTETTGLSGEDRIIEIYISTWTPGTPPEEGEFYSRFNPEGRRSNPRALEVHKIRDEALLHEPLFRARLDEVLEHLEGRIFVAHNAGFDKRMLAQELEREGISWAPPLMVDTCKVARRLWPQLNSHTLEYLAGLFGFENVTHEARADVFVLRRLWREFSIQNPDLTLADLLR
jgi:hypothetical protein